MPEHTTTLDANALCERFGISKFELQRAVQIAKERFNGDVELGIYWVHANAFALNVKGDRAAWNDDYARRMKERSSPEGSTAPSSPSS